MYFVVAGNGKLRDCEVQQKLLCVGWCDLTTTIEKTMICGDALLSAKPLLCHWWHQQQTPRSWRRTQCCSRGYCYKWIQVGHCGHWSETHSSPWWSQHFQVSRRWSPPSSSALAPEKHGTLYISKPAVEEEALPRPKKTFELLRLAQLSCSCFTDAVNLLMFHHFP